jgi:hypothetical protein
VNVGDQYPSSFSYLDAVKPVKIQINDFKVDKLTNSIENVVSGDCFKTDILPVSQKELKSVFKKDGWKFNWNLEFNERGRTVYKLVIPGNLIAFACKQSFYKGTEGYVSFHAKTRLIDHYVKTLGATHLGGHLMIINTQAALKLIDTSFDK